MKQILTVAGSVGLLLLIFSGFCLAQNKTIRGNVCSSSHSQDETAGFLKLRVGSEVIDIDHRFSPNLGDIAGMSKRKAAAYAKANTTKYLPSGKSLDERLGAELIVTYHKTRSGYNQATAITSTGQRKKTSSCE